MMTVMSMGSACFMPPVNSNMSTALEIVCVAPAAIAAAPRVA
jgi:hypothetical protein